MRTKLTCQCNLILETESKIFVLVTFIQRFVTQSELCIVFTKMLLFSQKTKYFLNERHDSYKNADGNWNSYITKLIPSSKLTFQKQLIKAKAEVKVSVNQNKVKVKNFIIPIFYIFHKKVEKVRNSKQKSKKKERNRKKRHTQ